jgi:hypothetical protein
VASRTFEDSAGVLWEVFEVHRASEAPRGVSAGLEKGWLAFASANGKRRLAPFPAEWESSSASELELLCAAARVANPPRSSGEAALGIKERITATKIGERSKNVPSEQGVAAREGDGDASLVRDAVRVFAHEARASKLPAIEAMVRLKALLLERYGGSDVEAATRADATDMRRIRRWFVEAFYFERPA